MLLNFLYNGDLTRSDLEFYRRSVLWLCRLFDVESGAFVFNFQIHNDFDLDCKTVIFRNRSPYTNTYGVGRFRWDQNLYSHYQLVWYKTVYDEWGEETIFDFYSKERNCRIFLFQHLEKFG